jgi:hypothetical protein
MRYNTSIPGALVFAFLVMTTTGCQKTTSKSQTTENASQTAAVIQRFERAFKQLPSDTTSLAFADSTSALQLVSVGRVKVALLRMDSKLFVYTTNGKRAELLRAENLKPLKIPEE